MLLMPVQSYRQQKNVMLFFPLVCLQLHYSTKGDDDASGKIHACSCL